MGDTARQNTAESAQCKVLGAAELAAVLLGGGSHQLTAGGLLCSLEKFESKVSDLGPTETFLSLAKISIKNLFLCASLYQIFAFTYTILIG